MGCWRWLIALPHTEFLFLITFLEAKEATKLTSFFNKSVLKSCKRSLLSVETDAKEKYANK